MEIIILIHILSCLFLTGLIWTIQAVHYPSFHFVNNESFKEFSHFHQHNMTKVVAPIMIVELVSAFLLIYLNTNSLTIVNFLSVITIWLITAFISVPIHKSLVLKKDYKLIDRLVYTNWLRTYLWSLRSFVLLIFLSKLVTL